MKNNYSILDEKHSTVPFRLPPIECGEYLVTDDFGDVHKYHFRRMPRAMRYTGRYGVFYYDPDAHWILVGYVDNDNIFQVPKELPKPIERRLALFIMGNRELQVLRCAWCGHKLDSGFIHQKEVCSKNLKST